MKAAHEKLERKDREEGGERQIENLDKRCRRNIWTNSMGNREGANKIWENSEKGKKPAK